MSYLDNMLIYDVFELYNEFNKIEEENKKWQLYLAFKPVKNVDNKKGTTEYYGFEAWKKEIENKKYAMSITKEKSKNLIEKYEKINKEKFKTPKNGGENNGN